MHICTVNAVELGGTYAGQQVMGFYLVAVPRYAQDESIEMGTFQVSYRHECTSCIVVNIVWNSVYISLAILRSSHSGLQVFSMFTYLCGRDAGGRAEGEKGVGRGRERWEEGGSVALITSRPPPPRQSLAPPARCLRPIIARGAHLCGSAMTSKWWRRSLWLPIGPSQDLWHIGVTWPIVVSMTRWRWLMVHTSPLNPWLASPCPSSLVQVIISDVHTLS